MSASALWYAGLPDGVTDVLVGPQGGLFVAGFDSLKRRCLVLYAPPFGLPLRTVSTLPYRDFGRSAPTVLAARDPRPAVRAALPAARQSRPLADVALPR